MSAEIQPPEKILKALENIEAKKHLGKEALEADIQALKEHNFFVARTPSITAAQIKTHERVVEVLENVEGTTDPEVTAALEAFAEKLERVFEEEDSETNSEEELRPAAPEEDQELPVVIGTPIEEEATETEYDWGEVPDEPSEPYERFTRDPFATEPTELGAGDVDEPNWSFNQPPPLPSDATEDEPHEDRIDDLIRQDDDELMERMQRMLDEGNEEVEAEASGILERTRDQAGGILGGAAAIGVGAWELAKSGRKKYRAAKEGAKEVGDAFLEFREDFDEINKAFGPVEGYLENIEANPEMRDIIANLIIQYAKQKGRSVEDLTAELDTYLQQEIFKGTEVLEADTDELKELLEHVEGMTPKEIRELTHATKKEIEKEKREKEKTERELANLEKDIARIEKRSTTTVEQGTGVKMVQQTPEDAAKLKQLESDLADKRESIEGSNETLIELNKGLNIVAHGSKNKLRKSRRVSGETMLTHIHGFIYEQENPGAVNYEKKARFSLKETQKSIRETTKFIDKDRRYKLRGASRREVLSFLGSTEGPFAAESDATRKVIGQLAEMKSGDLEGAKRWINNIAKSIKNPEAAQEAVIDVITNIQGLLDEKRFLKLGVDAFATRSLTILKNNLMHGYREYEALQLKRELREKGESTNTPEAMALLMDRIDNFNQKVLEARDTYNDKMPDDLKAFLKEFRKDYYYNKMGRGIKKGLAAGGKWAALTGVPKLAKGAQKIAGYTWETIKNNPKKSLAFAVLAPFSVPLGLWPPTATAILGGSGVGAYRLYRRFKYGPAPKVPKAPKPKKKPAKKPINEKAANDNVETDEETKKAA